MSDFFDSVNDWFSDSPVVRATPRGAKGFNGNRDKHRSVGSSSPASRGGASSFSRVGRAARVANKAAVRKKSPEVMVKITGSSNGYAKAGSHLDYISRNGEVEVENELGEKIIGNRAIREQKELMRITGIPELGKKREFLNVVFSMPKDTPIAAMKAAVAEFCKDEFSNRRYLMAFHDDTDHRHIHLQVGTRDIDRADEPRLSPRKADLMDWRAGFADRLRANGVDAAASTRATRFNYKKGRDFVVEKIIERKGYSSVHENKSKVLNDAVVSGIRPTFEQKSVFIERAAIKRHWEIDLAALKGSGNTQGIVDAANILKDADKVPSSRFQDDYDSALNVNAFEELKGFIEQDDNVIPSNENDSGLID